MSLAVRLTLSFAGLILALGLAAFVGVRALTDDLTAALGESAASVSRSVVTVLRGEFSRKETTASSDADAKPPQFYVETEEIRGPPVAAKREIRVVVNGRELNPVEIAKHLQHTPPSAHRGIAARQRRGGGEADAARAKQRAFD